MTVGEERSAWGEGRAEGMEGSVWSTGRIERVVSVVWVKGVERGAGGEDCAEESDIFVVSECWGEGEG